MLPLYDTLDDDIDPGIAAVVDGGQHAYPSQGGIKDHPLISVGPCHEPRRSTTQFLAMSVLNTPPLLGFLSYRDRARIFLPSSPARPLLGAISGSFEKYFRLPFHRAHVFLARFSLPVFADEAEEED